MAIKIICDSTSSITREYAEKFDVQMIPISMSVASGEIFTESYAYENQAILDECLKKGNFPKTSQPPSKLFEEAFNKIISDGNEAIYIAMGIGLSSTVEGARAVKNQIDKEDKISIVDSGNSASIIFLYIQEAVEMIEAGKSREEIVAWLKMAQKESYMQFVPDTLEYLKRGGRIGKVAALIGGLLNIKPILTLKQNILSTAEKVFGAAKAVGKIVAAIPKTAKRILVVQVGQSAFFGNLLNSVKAAFTNIRVETSDISASVGVHTGPAFGVAVLKEVSI